MYELREIAHSDMEFLRLAEADYLKSVACFDSICGNIRIFQRDAGRR